MSPTPSSHDLPTAWIAISIGALFLGPVAGLGLGSMLMWLLAWPAGWSTIALTLVFVGLPHAALLTAASLRWRGGRLSVGTRHMATTKAIITWVAIVFGAASLAFLGLAHLLM